MWNWIEHNDQLAFQQWINDSGLLQWYFPQYYSSWLSQVSSIAKSKNVMLIVEPHSRGGWRATANWLENAKLIVSLLVIDECDSVVSSQWHMAHQLVILDEEREEFKKLSPFKINGANVYLKWVERFSYLLNGACSIHHRRRRVLVLERERSQRVVKKRNIV